MAGFYSLAASAVEKRRVPSRVGRNMPEPVPVILLGQLAVDSDYQGRGLGTDLMVDGARRVLATAETIGARAIVVQALDEQVKPFYQPFGFRQFSEDEPLMLVLPMPQLATSSPADRAVAPPGASSSHRVMVFGSSPRPAFSRRLESRAPKKSLNFVPLVDHRHPDVFWDRRESVSHSRTYEME